MDLTSKTRPSSISSPVSSDPELEHPEQLVVACAAVSFPAEEPEMRVHHRKRIVIGIILIAVGIGIAAATATTTTASDVSRARGAQPHDFGVAFGTEVEEQLVDLRLPVVFGVVGVGLIISGFVHRRR
jgi:multisubunit Na+/H+ antiporter MnhB subunit